MKNDFSFLYNRQPGVMGESEIHHSAVAVTLLEAPDGEDILLEVRSEKIAHQPGDICCPGGMAEAGETWEQAAVREMAEELLVQPDQITVLGPLDILHNGSMCIHPYVCLLRDYDGNFSREEVTEVFRVPLAFFLETEPDIHEVTWRVETGEDFPVEKIHGGKNYPWRKLKNRIRFYEYDGRVIWGLTAKILESLAVLVRQHRRKA